MFGHADASCRLYESTKFGIKTRLYFLPIISKDLMSGIDHTKVLKLSYYQ